SVYAVHGPLAILAQMGFGGVYSDREYDISEIHTAFRGIGYLITAFLTNNNAERLGARGRLLVVVSNFRGSLWTWLEQPADTTMLPRLEFQSTRGAPRVMDVLRDAIREVRSDR